MYKKMLVPLDGSELSEVTFRYAKELAGRFAGLEVILFHACTPDDQGALPMHRLYIDRSVELIRQEAARQAEGRQVNVHGALAEGAPAEAILRFVEKNKVDLILMATHGRSGISRWAMGSVAYRVLRSVKVPVLLVRAGIEEAIIEDRLPERRIMVPLDGSRGAEAILPYVEQMTEQWGKDVVQIILTRVCEPPDVSADYPSDMPLTWEEHVKRENAKCRLVSGTYLADIEKRFRDAGFRVRSEIPLGGASREIITLADSIRANLIAMVIHGRSGISRWAYGNTTEEVMMGIRTPILLVKA
jgi:nucleotide-binding universal stress UspA family protein